MTNNIDTLMDSAFAKDRTSLPAQPAVPDAALLSYLEASVPAAQSSIAATGSGSVAGIGLSKFFLAVAGSLIIGAASYILSNSPVELSNLKNPMIFLFQDSVKQAKPVDSIQKKEAQIIEKAQEKNTVTTMPSDTVSLIMPQATPKKYQSDSTTVPIRKHR